MTNCAPIQNKPAAAALDLCMFLGFGRGDVIFAIWKAFFLLVLENRTEFKCCFMAEGALGHSGPFIFRRVTSGADRENALNYISAAAARERKLLFSTSLLRQNVLYNSTLHSEG